VSRQTLLRVEEELQALMNLQPPPAREQIDRVLTDGYAEALELEVQRLKLARELEDQLSRTGDAEYAEEALRLNREISIKTAHLRQLRHLLGEASRRFGRNPLAEV
jgi:hypothetical protein